MPYEIFLEKTSVKRIVARSLRGSFGLLPHRLDCTAALIPGILTYETEADGETSIAVDGGVLVKVGMSVVVSARDAIKGPDLGELHEAIKRRFLSLDKQEELFRSALAKVESSLIRTLMEFQHE